MPEGLNVILAMKTSIRRTLGVALAVLAVVAVAALAFAGVPLLTHSTKVVGSTPNASVIIASTHLHWSLVAAGLAFVIGMLLLFVPGRKDAATKQP